MSRPSTAREVPRPAAGFSIVELMVAMTLGLGLGVVLSVASIHAGSGDSYGQQDQVGRLQENVRITTNLVARVVRQAGYRQLPTGRLEGDQIFDPAGGPMFGTEGDGSAPGTQDVLTVRFQGSGGTGLAPGTDDTMVDCLGNSVGTDIDGATGTARIAQSTFQVRTGADGRPWLMCSLDGGTTFMPLVPDVEAMEVLYGVAPPISQADSLPNVSRYVPATQVGDFRQVLAVQLHLLFRSEIELAPLTDTATYDLGGRSYGPFNDRRIRQAVRTTVTLRNRAL